MICWHIQTEIFRTWPFSCQFLLLSYFLVMHISPRIHAGEFLWFQLCCSKLQNNSGNQRRAKIFMLERGYTALLWPAELLWLIPIASFMQMLSRYLSLFSIFNFWSPASKWWWHTSACLCSSNNWNFSCSE